MKPQECYVINRLIDALFRIEDALYDLICILGEEEELGNKYKEIIDEIDKLTDETLELRNRIDKLIDKMLEVMKSE